jgi:antitoxin (DNA-binding transcriptional repressor) of toxin-antitoxin stability system
MKAGRRKQEARTATVRELRNRFADVAKWIADGEEVTILRGGIVFATLAPPTAAAAPAVDWAARFEKRPPIPAKRKLTAEETQAFYDEMKGSL